MRKAQIHRYCGRDFSGEDLERIRALIDSPDRPHRLEISRRVCRQLRWIRANGALKDMSCRVALLRMHKDGLIELPPPRTRNGNGRWKVLLTERSAEQAPVSGSVTDLSNIHLQVVSTRSQSLLWNELIARYHYLGYTPLPGAQIRYLLYGSELVLGAMGFGAAAWKMAPRDNWIGWSGSQREINLHLIVNNNRFLILPNVRVRNLASRILSIVAKELPEHWQERYAYRPVLLETLVEDQRFAGTCYKATNWLHLGHTQGRGKLDRKHENAVPIKSIYVYPLTRKARAALLYDKAATDLKSAVH